MTPCRTTRCCAHNVGATFRNCRDVAGMSCYTLHSPYKITLSHLSCHPTVTVSTSTARDVAGNFFAKADLAIRGCRNYTLAPIAQHCASNVGLRRCPSTFSKQNTTQKKGYHWSRPGAHEWRGEVRSSPLRHRPLVCLLTQFFELRSNKTRDSFVKATLLTIFHTVCNMNIHKSNHRKRLRLFWIKQTWEWFLPKH